MVSPYDFTWPGGVTAHISQLAQELKASGHQVQILAPHSPAREGSEVDAFVPLGRSVPVFSGGSVARLSLSWWLYRRVRDLLAEESFDIIHLHEPLAPVLPLCVLECSNTVNIGTFHAYHSPQYLYRFSQPIVKRWHQRLHGGIAVSPAAHQYVNNFFPRDYRIIPNGIAVEHFAGPVQPWPQYQDGKTNILFVGRLEKRKGLKYLLAAYSRLKWEYPDLRLLVVGAGQSGQGIPPDIERPQPSRCGTGRRRFLSGFAPLLCLRRHFLLPGHRAGKFWHCAAGGHGRRQAHRGLGHRGLCRHYPGWAAGIALSPQGF